MQRQEAARKWVRFRLARRSMIEDQREDEAGISRAELRGAGLGLMLIALGLLTLILLALKA